MTHQRSRANTALITLVLAVAAVLPLLPRATSAAPETLTNDSKFAAGSLAREAWTLHSLGLFNAPDNLPSGLSGVVPLPPGGKPELTAAVLDFDTKNQQLLDTLHNDGMQSNPDIDAALGQLTQADKSAVSAGHKVTVQAEEYFRAIDDLLFRNGAASPAHGPPDAVAIKRDLPAALALTGPASPASPSPTTSTTPAEPSSSPINNERINAPDSTATGSNTTRILGGAALLLLIMALTLLWRGTRRTTTAATAASLNDLLDVSRRLTSAAPGDNIDRAVVREAMGVVPALVGALVRRDDGKLTLAHATRPELIVEDALGSGVIERVAETGQPVVQVSATEPSIRSLPAAIAAVPLVGSGAVIAVLLLIRDGNEPFTNHERDLLMGLAPVAAAAMHSAQQAQAAVDEALTDPLTDVGNRRRLDRELPDILAGADGSATALIMLDLDHFKAVNDTHGHAAGDAMLRAIADLASNAVRPQDRVYRYGGEEFCIVLPDTTVTDAAAIAERIRATIAANPHHLGPALDVPATASFGVSDTTAGGDAAALLARADSALYKAKEEGRDKVLTG